VNYKETICFYQIMYFYNLTKSLRNTSLVT